MKKILFLLLPNIAVAQTYIAPSISFAKTSIYNKDDVNHKRLPSTIAFAPAFGLQIGRTKGSMFYEVGINYNPIVQNYKGWYESFTPNPKNATASKTLNYLQIPILIGKSFLIDNKVSPFIAGGLYVNYLLNYTTKHHADYSNLGFGLPPNVTTEYNQTGNIIEMRRETTAFVTYETSKWFFNRFVLGTNFNFGIDYNLNSRLQFRVASNNNISITEPETDAGVSFNVKSGNADLLGISPYKSYNPKEIFSGIVDTKGPVPARPQTFLISNSIGISLKYSLNKTNY